MTPVYKLLWGVLYKPHCMQLIATSFMAIHQGFALSRTLTRPWRPKTLPPNLPCLLPPPPPQKTCNINIYLLENKIFVQERKRHINLRKSLGHPAGQTGLYQPVSQELLVIDYGKTDKKGNFAGTPAGCPRDTRPMWFSLMCVFCSPFLVQTSTVYGLDIHDPKCS